MATEDGPTPELRDAASESDNQADRELNPLHLRFVELISEGKSMMQASVEMGLNLRRLYRWRERDDVRAAFRAIVNAGMARARAILAKGSAEAAESLLDVATGRAEADPAAVSAARAVIDSAIKLGEFAGDAAATKHEVKSSGVMLVPVPPGGVDGWEAAAREAQRKLKADAAADEPEDPE